jgi:hypothetical protein
VHGQQQLCGRLPQGPRLWGVQLPSGDCYVGEKQEDTAHGHGVYLFATGFGSWGLGDPLRYGQLAALAACSHVGTHCKGGGACKLKGHFSTDLNCWFMGNPASMCFICTILHVQSRLSMTADFHSHRVCGDRRCRAGAVPRLEPDRVVSTGCSCVGPVSERHGKRDAWERGCP